MNISGNTVFIPGSTSGIGLALALELQARGNTVIVGGRRAGLLERIAADHPGIDTVQIDTADSASIDAAAKEVLAKHPDLNVLITMAGIMRIEDWHKPESFLASAESVVTTNVLGPIRLIAAFIQHLQAQPDATIVTVSSGLAFATPLDEFVAEVAALLQAQPDAKEIQVERVKFLRYGEARGDYDQVVATLNASDPHGNSHACTTSTEHEFSGRRWRCQRADRPTLRPPGGGAVIPSQPSRSAGTECQRRRMNYRA